MNWYWILGAIIASTILLIYLVRTNIRDKRELEKQLNSDYKKTKDEEDEMEIE
jgi:hypothetical protein